MGCDIHIITEVKKNGKWEYVPEVPKSLDTRNYTTFAVLSGVRDSFNSNIFPVKGLPSDISGKKFCFESDRPHIERLYNEDSTTCLVIGDEIVSELYSCGGKTHIEITEAEYVQIKKEPDESRYQLLSWSETGGIRTYHVCDANAVGGEWKKIPFKQLFATFDEFAKKHYENEWDEDAQDYGYWRVDFESDDYHSHNYITLKEFEDADYTDYTLKKCKISKKFYQAFISNDGVLPSIFKVEDSAIGDIRDVFQEAVSPTVTIAWLDTDISDKKYPIFAAAKELKEIAEKYNVVNHEDVRIVFAFDN